MRNIGKIKKTSIITNYLIILLYVFVIVVFVSFLIYVENFFSYKKEHFENQKLESARLLTTESELLSVRFRSTIYDLLILSDLHSLKSFYSGDEKSRKNAEADMLNYSEKMQIFDQIRYVDSGGNEIIRVNLDSGVSKLESDDLLQNKASRYYFKETAKLLKSEVYISPFDLNIENGEIEKPLKPVIRFSTPVYAGEKFSGIIIVNYLGKNIIDDFKKLNKSNPGKLFLVNEEGYWIYKDNPGEEWGFLYPNRMTYTVKSLCPEGFGIAQEKGFFQKYIRNSLFSIKKVEPYSDLKVFSEEKAWYVVQEIKDKEFGLGKESLTDRFLPIALIIFFGDIILSLILSKIIYQRNVFKNSIEHAALFDALTDLANRNMIFNRIKNQLEMSKRYKFSFALCFIDLDGFKKVNDTLGHKAGDMLLKGVAERISRNVRGSDLVGRYGGDEFIVLLSSINNVEECSIVVSKILESLKKEFQLGDKIAKIGASVGILFVEPGTEETPESLITKADSAMYEIKKSGKNGFGFYKE